jgi:ABC-2 type transport system permease protein
MATTKAFLCGFLHEMRVLRRERVLLLAYLAFLGLVAFVLVAEERRVDFKGKLAEVAELEESQRLDGLRKKLREIQSDLAQGKKPSELPPYRDPRNAAYMGGGPAVRVAILPSAPLAVIAVGVSDLLPSILRPTSGSKETFLYVDEIENPSNLSSCPLDLNFVIVVVFPLMVLIFVFNLLSNEVEAGTFAMTLASAGDPEATLLGKFVARALMPILVSMLLMTVLIGTLVGFQQILSWGMLEFLGMVFLYGGFWAALAAAVDVRVQGSSTSALVLFGLWVILTLLLPASINSLAEWLYPAPGREAMVLAARVASTDTDRSKDANLAHYLDEHQDAANSMMQGKIDDATLQRLVLQDAAFEKVEAVIREHGDQLKRQNEFSDILGYLSPAILVYRGMASVAGSDELRYSKFMQDIDTFHLGWREFFLGRARAGQMLRIEDYDQLPRFKPVFSNDLNEPRLLYWLVGVAVPEMLLLLWAWRGLGSRCRLSNR